MKLANEFTIDAPVDQVWTTMLDFERVAACVPGSQVIGPAQDGGLEANISVKVGPMTMTYLGVVRIVEEDPQARRAVMQAKARETRGQGSATAQMILEVHDTQPVTVAIATDLDVTGRVAQMGRGVMQDVAGRIVADFAKGLQGLVTSNGSPPSAVIGADRAEPEAGRSADDLPPPAATTPASSLSAGALAGVVIRGRLRALTAWIRRLLGRP